MSKSIDSINNRLLVRFMAVPLALSFAACDTKTPDGDASDAEIAADQSPAPMRGHKWLGKLDADGDGAISRAEAADHRLAEKFGALDKSNDGLLTADELAAWHKGGKRRHGPGHVGGKASKLDSDGDGVISREEAQGHRIEERFAAVDQDGDGKLTADEMSAFRTSMRDPAARAKLMIEKMDADADGSLSAAEVAGSRFERRFVDADTDGDGKVTLDEMTAYKQAHRSKHPRHGKHRPGDGAAR